MKAYSLPKHGWAALVVLIVGVFVLLLLSLSSWYPSPDDALRNFVTAGTGTIALVAPTVRLIKTRGWSQGRNWWPAGWYGRVIGWLIGVPDIRGRWEGWTRDYLNLKMPRRFAIECKQYGNELQIVAWSENGATAETITGNFIFAGDKPRIFNFCESRNSKELVEPSRNVHLLEIKHQGAEMFLKGEYFNNRKRLQDATWGNRGEIEVKKVGRKLRFTGGFGPIEHWGMPESPWEKQASP